MELEILEKKYISFKKGVEEAPKSFTENMGKNVKGMRTEINKLKEDINNIKVNSCKVCEHKSNCGERFDDIQ